MQSPSDAAAVRRVNPPLGCNRSDAVFGIPLQGSCDYNLTTAMLEPLSLGTERSVLGYHEEHVQWGLCSPKGLEPML